MEKPKRARRRKPDTAKADLKPAARNVPEGRVSGAIRNPKGMRRSIGLQSMGATPKTNRSAKDGARSFLIHPSHQGVCWRHDTEDSRVTPGDLHGSRPTAG